MPGLPDEDVPAGRLRVPCLKYWHAARACAYAWTHGVDAHDWMPGLSDEDVPAGRLGVPCLKYWHASQLEMVHLSGMDCCVLGVV
jgi:hypothetical protein